MGDTEDESEEVRRVWTRLGDETPQDDDGAIPFDDLHLHRYCDVYPFPKEDDDELLEKRRDRRDWENDEEPIEIRFVGEGIVGRATRKLLKHTPLAVLSLTLIFFGSAEVMPGAQGVSELIPSVPVQTPTILFLVVGVLLYAALIYLLTTVGLLDGGQLYRGAVVYGLLATLVIGTAVSIALVTIKNPQELPQNIIFTSGYLLLLLLGGVMIYDGMLRMEHMFEHLDTLEIVEDKEAYTSFKRRLKENLSQTWPIYSWWPFRRVPTAFVFAVLFVVQFWALWEIGQGPQHLDYSVTLYVNVGVNIVLLIITVKFLIFIKLFYQLVTEDLTTGPNPLGGREDTQNNSNAEPNEENRPVNADGIEDTVSGNERRILGYQIDHEDGYAGYSELGKFVSRVNVLLILAGLFLVYRLYVHGGRTPPGAMAPGFEPTVGMLVWFADFVIPIIGYALAAAAWFYYSFWHLHLRMIREQERLWEENEEEKQDLKRRELAPTWPVNPNQIMTIISGAATPVALAVTRLL